MKTKAGDADHGRSNLYFGGVSTDPEVRKLEAHFTDMESMRGKLIRHVTIEKLIGVKRGVSHYKSAVTRWRKHVESGTGIVISGRGEAAGKGFLVLDHGEQLTFGIGERRGAGRKMKRWHEAVANTDEDKLTAEQSKTRDYEMAGAARMSTAIIELRRLKPAPPKAVEPGPARTAVEG